MFNHIGENWRAYTVLATSLALLGFSAQEGLEIWNTMEYAGDQSKIAMLSEGTQASEASLNAANATEDAKASLIDAAKFGVPGIILSVVAMSSIARKAGAKKK